MMCKKNSVERNPFHEPNSEPILQKAIVAFIDVLGFKELVKDAKDNNESQELFEKFYETLKNSWLSHLDNWREELYSYPFIGGNQDSYKFRIFTDCVLIGCPIKKYESRDNQEAKSRDDYGQAEKFFNIFNDLALFQSQLIENNFFIRGAVTIGELYMDDDIIYGYAGIEAYEAEAKNAIYPRIILTESAINFYDDLIINMDDKYRKKILEDIKNKWLFIGDDKKVSINYLESIHVGDHPYLESLERHKNNIEKNIKKNVSDKKILAKYLWSAYCHNQFCDNHSYYTYKVDGSYWILRS